MAVQIISININSIRNSDRRAGLLQWLRPLVVCLQEAHCASDVECQSWFRSSGFQSVVSPGSQKSCGCVILFCLSLSLVYSAEPCNKLIQMQLLTKIDKQISDHQNTAPTQPFTRQDLEKSIKQMANGKFPGLSGLPAEFYLQIF